MIDLCRYILQGGKQCEQAAIKGEYYCRHHQFVRKAVAEATPQADPYAARKPLPFVFPEDRAAVQINYFLVLQAINDGRLDQKTANLMIRLLRACDANLKKGPLNEQESDQGAGAGEREGSEEAVGSTHVSKTRHGAPAPGASAPASVISGADEFWQRRAEIVLKHHDRFLEIEKKYGDAPDYGDRLNALADKLLEKEGAV
jgi:hypothetical protein